MSETKLNRLVALTVFLVTVAVYLKTLSTTVVFWDVGEFCAAARLMQIPHPPGSPLFLFLARVASMIPFRDDIAARMHAVSAFGSALGIMFLYLVSVNVVTHFRGAVSSAGDRFLTYGSSAIAAWSLAFSSTYWDNAIEAEVYGMGMFFVSAVLWLALRWWEEADEPRSDRYLLMISYLLGLSTGVHILALLVIIPVLMIMYFRRYEVTRRSFVRFCVISLSVFFVVYPGIVQLLPSFLDGEFGGVRSDAFAFVPVLVVAGAVYGAVRGFRTGQKLIHLVSLAFLFIVLGYTTYTQVIMRANVENLPMNENTPNTLAHLMSYLTREQYGETPMLKGESWDNDQQAYVDKLFPRRWSREPMHEPTRSNYSSDWDFFWRYQVNHMYIRYVLQNFVGAESDRQDAGVSWKDTWGIPLILGMFGFYYHVRKDWKFALVFFVMTTIMGIVLDLYQNQQDPQPRERDYFYVGAFYCVALWIGIGIVGVMDSLRQKLHDRAFRLAAPAAAVLFLLVVPVNLARCNWFEHDRSRNYIAWDYSYNFLQSCEQNAILFTNGDNDTFPLWYLQDVEGVRRDVRIVCLSLVNTPWYAHHLKNETPHGAMKVPISLTDDQIDRLSARAWRPQQADVPVPLDIAGRFGVSDTAVLRSGKLTFTMAGMPFGKDVRILRIQDMMVYNIIRTNRWDRPVYFAITCSPDSHIGLDEYLWLDGLTYRLKPVKVTNPEAALDIGVMSANVLADNVRPAVTQQWGYLYRNLDKSDVYYDENALRMVQNYRFNFSKLGEYAINIEKNGTKAREIFAAMQRKLPIDAIPMSDWRISAYFLSVFKELGDTSQFDAYARPVEQDAWNAILNNIVDASDPFMPYRALIDIYDERHEYRAAVNLLNRAAAQYPNVKDIETRLAEFQQKLAAQDSSGSPSGK